MFMRCFFLQVTDSVDDAQLTPPNLKVSVRPHDTLTTEFVFQSLTDYPVDVYFLVDLSYTMRDDLETVSRLTKHIAESFTAVTKDLRMGFGAFVDKPVFPFVVPTKEALANPCLSGVGVVDLHCDPPFLYKHILSLTGDLEQFEKATVLSRVSFALFADFTLRPSMLDVNVQAWHMVRAMHMSWQLQLVLKRAVWEWRLKSYSKRSRAKMTKSIYNAKQSKMYPCVCITREKMTIIVIA